MIRYETHTVVEIIDAHEDIIKVRLNDNSRAYALTGITPVVNVGDEVVINTTAVDLSLGTGGWHFILWNGSCRNYDVSGSGHIMKLRYTPVQINVGVAEEFDSWNNNQQSLGGTPVIVAPLHSHIAPIVTYIKTRNEHATIAVLISDGASLPVCLSDTLREMKHKGLVNSTISFGHAFGGDIETINIFTALLAAQNIVQADYIIVTMGPGIVGSNTTFGFTGIESAYHLDSASKLEGKTIGILRASSADMRERHQGISHHSLTTYSRMTHQRHTFGIIEDHPLSSLMFAQIRKSELDQIHHVISMPMVGIVDEMEMYSLDISSMGRKARDDELFYEMAATSARIALGEFI